MNLIIQLCPFWYGMHSLSFSTCIWVASKMEDVKAPCREDISYISDHSVSVETIVVMEARICKLLQFRLHRVTPFHFVHIYLRASNVDYLHGTKNTFEWPDLMQTPIVSMTLYLLELSRTSYRLTHKLPSLLAASCVYLARATLGIKNKSDGSNEPNRIGLHWTKTLQHYTDYKTTDMTDTITTLYMLQIAAESAASVGVNGCPAFHKYNTKEKFHVSRKVPPLLEDLGLPDRDETTHSFIRHSDHVEPYLNCVDYAVRFPVELM
jgi:cyclin-A